MSAESRRLDVHIRRRLDCCRCCRAANLSKRSRESLVLHEINQAAEFDEKYKERPSLDAVGWLAALAFGICWDCWFGAIGFLAARSLGARRAA